MAVNVEGDLPAIAAQHNRLQRSKKKKRINSSNGYGPGSELNHQGTTGFGPCCHLPGFHFGVTLVLTHSQMASNCRLSSCDCEAQPAQPAQPGSSCWGLSSDTPPSGEHAPRRVRQLWPVPTQHSLPLSQCFAKLVFHLAKQVLSTRRFTHVQGTSTFIPSAFRQRFCLSGPGIASLRQTATSIATGTATEPSTQPAPSAVHVMPAWSIHCR